VTALSTWERAGITQRLAESTCPYGRGRRAKDGYPCDRQAGDLCDQRAGRLCESCRVEQAEARRRRLRSRTAVYRIYDRGGHLLYVGLSRTPERRARWTWHYAAALGLDPGRIEPTWWPDRASTRAAEVYAIRAEHPRLNGEDAHGRYGPACGGVGQAVEDAPDPEAPEAGDG
jgi:hypothetical protein